jgi:hypothetical protein
MIKGLTKELIFKYTYEDEYHRVCIIGVDDEGDIGYTTFNADSFDLSRVDDIDLSYFSYHSELDELRDIMLCLPESERKTIVAELIRLFASDIDKAIKRIIQNSE